jgi:D-3-phosphoglycerate dehydrogenase
MKTSEQEIKVSAYSFVKNDTLKSELIKKFPNSKFASPKEPFPEEELIQFIGNSEILLVGREKITDSLLQNCPHLRFISKFGVGTDNIDFAACEKHNVSIGWTGGVNKLSVAELVLGFMLGVSHNIFLINQLLKENIWYKNGGFELSGKTVGIIGLGNIGRELVRLLRPFHCKILANDILDMTEHCAEHGIHFCSKEEIYEKSDFISLHIPLNASTKYLIHDDTLKKMKKNCILINASRGGIIHEQDLINALKNKTIAAACLDVFEQEPIQDFEKYKLQNLFTTTHIGGNTIEAQLAMGRSAIQHIQNYLAGKK